MAASTMAPLLQRRGHHYCLLAVAILLVSSTPINEGSFLFVWNKGFLINPVVTAFSPNPVLVVPPLHVRRTGRPNRRVLHPMKMNMMVRGGYEGPPFRLVRCFPDLSRRQAQEAVSEGRVLVGGEIVSSPSRLLVGGEVLTLDGHTISWERRATKLLVAAAAAENQRDDASHGSEEDNYCDSFRYWKYNKPVGVTCTMDEFDRRGLWYALPPYMLRDDKTTTRGQHQQQQQRLFPAGRLDLDSRGLVLLTDDGRLADALLQPRFQHTKEYVVVVQPPLSDQALDQLEEGVVISTVQQRTQKETTAKTQPCVVEELQTKPDGTAQRLRIVLTEGRNRQIRKMMEVVGSTVASLTRVRHGVLQLGTLPVGQAVEIVGDELESLLSSARASHDGGGGGGGGVGGSGGDRIHTGTTRPRRRNKSKPRQRRSGGGKLQE